MPFEYKNSKYTVSAKHFGYNGQIEYLTDTTHYVNPAPWTTCSTTNAYDHGSDYEAMGGGDIKYYSEFRRIRDDVLGTLKAYKYGTSSTSTYWMAGRDYDYFSENDYRWQGATVQSDGSTNSWSLYSYTYNYKSKVGLAAETRGYPIRPMVVLKSGVSADGSGTSADPWVLK